MKLRINCNAKTLPRVLLLLQPYCNRTATVLQPYCNRTAITWTYVSIWLSQNSYFWALWGGDPTYLVNYIGGERLHIIIIMFGFNWQCSQRRHCSITAWRTTDADTCCISGVGQFNRFVGRPICSVHWHIKLWYSSWNKSLNNDVYDGIIQL